jgi:hypothetical protein
MNTKLIMTLCAVFLAIIGISLIFLPDEIEGLSGLGSGKIPLLLLQLLGGLYFGFSMLNWMTRTSVIGGIYNKPIVVANLSHFGIGGLALIKMLINNGSLPYWFWVLAGIYSIFALLFGILFSRSPTSTQKN